MHPPMSLLCMRKCFALGPPTPPSRLYTPTGWACSFWTLRAWGSAGGGERTVLVREDSPHATRVRVPRCTHIATTLLYKSFLFNPASFFPFVSCAIPLFSAFSHSPALFELLMLLRHNLCRCCDDYTTIFADQILFLLAYHRASASCSFPSSLSSGLLLVRAPPPLPEVRLSHGVCSPHSSPGNPGQGQ